VLVVEKNQEEKWCRGSTHTSQSGGGVQSLKSFCPFPEHLTGTLTTWSRMICLCLRDKEAVNVPVCYTSFPIPPFHLMWQALLLLWCFVYATLPEAPASCRLVVLQAAWEYGVSCVMGLRCCDEKEAEKNRR